jgi:opacity protein-like surface antigen
MRKLLIAAMLLMGGSAAYAQVPDVYAGAGVSYAQIDNVVDISRNFDLSSTAWKAFVGVRPLPFLGVEANYMDLGSKTRSFGFLNATADAHAFSAFAVGFVPLPVPFLDVFGKVGAARWSLSSHDNSSLFAIDRRGTDFAWGVGTQAHFGPLGVRLEYEQFDVTNTDGAHAVSLDAAWHFL